jgi:hypothetical protein
MGKKSSKSTNKPWTEAQPYILGGANAVNDAYHGNASQIQDATNSVTGLLPSIIEKYQQGNPNINAATAYNTDVLSGKYLNSNPYLDQVINQTGNDTRNQSEAALGLKGLTGGSNYADIVSRNVGNNASNLRFANFNAERDRQGQAAGQAPSLAAADYLGINPALGVLNASTTPLQAAGSYAGSLGGLLGGYGTKTATPSTASSISDGIGTALQLASLFSDARLKTDVRRVGQTDAGAPIYTYRYMGEGPFHMGVMAQEIANDQPDALGPEIGGFMTVNYAEVR